MISALIAFIRERFQPKVTIPLSLLLFAAPFSMAPTGLIDFAVGAVSTFLALLCVRIADDVVSAEADAVNHPQRGLACGRISAPHLLLGLTVVFGGLLLINVFCRPSVLGLIAMGLYYAFFFLGRSRLHLLVRPLFSNLVFLMIPLYAAGVDGPGAIQGALLMGLFAWAAAVAHEFGHSVHGEGEDQGGETGYSELLGPRDAAMLATAAFGLALAFGLLFWNHAGRPRLFIIALVMVALHLGYLCLRLIRKPCMARAKPFYVYGFIFFLGPYLGFTLDKLWKASLSMSSPAQIAYLILPIILAGTCNMIFVKSRVMPYFKKPMDHGVSLADGKRLFGDHKTWKGFLGMIVFSSFWLITFGILDHQFPGCRRLSLIPYEVYSSWQEGIYGAIWGFGYVLLELPNSYAKRRIDIHPGRMGRGSIGALFSFVDQADSVVGCLCAMLLFYVPAFMDLVAIFIFGVLVHYAMNVLLYLLKLKSQPL